MPSAPKASQSLATWIRSGKLLPLLFRSSATLLILTLNRALSRIAPSFYFSLLLLLRREYLFCGSVTHDKVRSFHSAPGDDHTHHPRPAPYRDWIWSHNVALRHQPG